MWVPIELSTPGTRLEVVTEDGGQAIAVAASLPFVDSKKEAPAQSLKV
jgi:hypothetical protein